jgi:hypothetical protein
MGLLHVPRIALSTILALLAFFHQAWAVGGSDGGGGKGVVCRNTDGSVRSVELLDLWEARVIYQRRIVSSSAPVEQQIKEGAERLKYIFKSGRTVGFQDGTALSGAEYTSWYIQNIAKNIVGPEINNQNVRHLRGVQLALTDDSFEEVSPDPSSGCRIEQLVVYSDMPAGGGTTRVLQNQDLIDQMDATNLASLALHEALYSFLREYGEKTSVRVRRAIGFIMSGQSFEPWDKYLKVPHVDCEGSYDPRFPYTYTLIHIVPFNRGNGLTVMAEFISGAPILGSPYQGSGFGDFDRNRSLDEIFKSGALKGHQFGVGAQNSPVDFDFGGWIRFETGNKAEFELQHSASGSTIAQPIRLSCKMVGATTKTGAQVQARTQLMAKTKKQQSE